MLRAPPQHDGRATAPPASGVEAPAALRLLIVAEIRLYREGLALSLGRGLGFEVSGTAATVAEALEAVQRTTPDLVVIDMATEGSIELAQRISEAGTGARIVALAIPETEDSVLSCAEAGVCAYVSRDTSLADLAPALHRAARGEADCSPRIAGTLMRRVAALSAEHRGMPRESPLTSREEEIVRLIDAGLSNKEIAQRLFIEIATVKNHVHNILGKLEVTRRGQAAARMRALNLGGGN